MLNMGAAVCGKRTAGTMGRPAMRETKLSSCMEDVTRKKEREAALFLRHCPP